MAYPGLLEDAAPLFRAGTRVPGAGVLLALPALVQSGVFDCAREIYGSLGPAFYGLRTTILALLLMALLRKTAFGPRPLSCRSSTSSLNPRLCSSELLICSESNSTCSQ